ncbi:MAG: hypothetical protein ACTHMG_15345 [Sphingomonas sp.]
MNDDAGPVATPRWDDWRRDGAAGRAPTLLLIADPGALAEEAVAAAEYVEARLLERIAWAAAAGRLGDHALVDLLLVEAQGAAPAELEAMLPRIDTLARATGARVVVALDVAQIDLVAAQLFGTAVQLLIAPTVTDRVAALVLAAAGDGGRLHDRVREGERERLQRLNEEVARIAEVLAQLARREPSPSRRGGLVGDRRGSYNAGAVAPGPGIEARDIRRAIRARRLRDQFFAPGLFEDPAWDMLLDLYAAELEDRAVSVSSLCIAAAVAPTTALRWIGKLTDAGLFERRPDPFDRRRAFMALTPTARDGMLGYCHAVREAGLVIA